MNVCCSDYASVEAMDVWSGEDTRTWRGGPRHSARSEQSLEQLDQREYYEFQKSFLNLKLSRSLLLRTWLLHIAYCMKLEWSWCLPKDSHGDNVADCLDVWNVPRSLKIDKKMHDHL